MRRGVPRAALSARAPGALAESRQWHPSSPRSQRAPMTDSDELLIAQIRAGLADAGTS